MNGRGGMGVGGPREKVSLRIQTLLALQELGIVIGVAIMVASIFMLMVSRSFGSRFNFTGLSGNTRTLDQEALP